MGLRHPGLWLDLGEWDYLDCYDLQLELLALRQQDRIPDTLLVVEHPPCVTLGRAAQAGHVLSAPDALDHAGIEVFRSDRGGDVTYHGPGQIVCYAILDLTYYGRDVHAHARSLEEVLIRTAGVFGLPAWRRPGYPGAWTADGKLGAIGIAVRRWVTLHGMALNVSPDLEHFAHIVPCGLWGESVTSLQGALGVDIDPDLVRSKLRHACADVFGLTLHDASPGDLTSSPNPCLPVTRFKTTP